MKNMIKILVLSALPVAAMAGGVGVAVTHGHAGAGHEMQGAATGAHENSAGQPGKPDLVDRTIEVTMDDSMRFSPDRLDFRAGETVRFLLRNNGRIRHEMVIGSAVEMDAHAQSMRSDPAMKHADPAMVSLAPGEETELIWQFDRPGVFDFACLLPGHLEAGMVGRIAVD